MKAEQLNDLAKEIRVLDQALINNNIDFLNYDMIKDLKFIGSLCRRHRRLCERQCNEANFNYALIEKVERRINALIHDFSVWATLRAEFQHDPRGNTCKIFIGN